MFALKSNRKSILYFLVGSILLCGLFFRFFNIDHMFYWFDETYTSLWVSGYQWDEVGDALADRVVSAADVVKFQRISPDKGVIDTVRALAKWDAQHPPLYYVMLRIWAGFFGDSITSIRTFSAFIGIAALPFLFRLCLMVFESRRVAWVCVMLACVSPLHVLYAREAREYGLWILTTILCHLALLRALKSRGAGAWGVYALSVAAGLYSHGFFITGLMAHWVYVLGLEVSGNGFRRLLHNPALRSFCIASLIAFATFIPWVAAVFIGFSTLWGTVSWTNEPVTFLNIVLLWGQNFSTIFLDVNMDFGIGDPVVSPQSLAFLFHLLLLALVLYSLWKVFGIASRKSAWFVVLSTAVPFLSLVFPDLLTTGYRSGIFRYLIPSYVGVLISLAGLLGEKTALPGHYRWHLILGMFLSFGILSCSVMMRSETWHTQVLGRETPEVARIIKQISHPLVVTSFYAKLFPLCRRLEPETRVLALTEKGKFEPPAGANNILVYDPPLWLKKKIQLEKGFALEQMPGARKLFLLREAKNTNTPLTSKCP